MIWSAEYRHIQDQVLEKWKSPQFIINPAKNMVCMAKFKRIKSLFAFQFASLILWCHKNLDNVEYSTALTSVNVQFAKRPLDPKNVRMQFRSPLSQILLRLVGCLGVEILHHCWSNLRTNWYGNLVRIKHAFSKLIQWIDFMTFAKPEAWATPGKPRPPPSRTLSGRPDTRWFPRTPLGGYL